MKKRIKICIVLILTILLVYVSNIFNIPNSMVLLEGERINLKTVYGIKSVCVSSETVESTSKKMNVEISLFGGIPIKNVDVSVIPNVKVIPVGKVIGVKLYTNGILVVGMGEINGKKPYQDCGIKEGDTIVEINSVEIESIKQLKELVNESNGEEIEIKYARDGSIAVTSITPVKIEDEYKLGFWVREAATGVGTLTYYVPSTGEFAALGHGIIDVDTNELINIESGEVVNSKILSIKKGENGIPGEIKGTILKQSEIGSISKNTEFGIYGKLTNSTDVNLENEMEVALRDEIKVGPAKILCMLDNGVTKEYDIEIEKLNISNDYDNKSMIIKVTDEELIEKTGGIIRGLSRAPIVQDGKFIGAVTHVLVQDPTQGYAVFADMMIKQMGE